MSSRFANELREKRKPILERTFWLAVNKSTGEVLLGRQSSGVVADRPALFISKSRVLQALGIRTNEVANPDEWEAVPFAFASLLKDDKP